MHCRGGGKHHSLLSLGTSLAFTCIKSECPSQAWIGAKGGGGGSSGISNDWCIKKQILEEFITVIQYSITQIVNKCFSLSQHDSRWGYARVSPFALCPAYPPVLQAIYIITIGNFRYVEIQLDSEARTQTEVINKQSFNFLCLCPLSLAAVLNSNISKVVYCLYLTGKETRIFVRGGIICSEKRAVFWERSSGKTDRARLGLEVQIMTNVKYPGIFPAKWRLLCLLFCKYFSHHTRVKNLGISLRCSPILAGK